MVTLHWHTGTAAEQISMCACPWKALLTQQLPNELSALVITPNNVYLGYLAAQHQILYAFSLLEAVARNQLDFTPIAWWMSLSLLSRECNLWSDDDAYMSEWPGHMQVKSYLRLAEAVCPEYLQLKLCMHTHDYHISIMLNSHVAVQCLSLTSSVSKQI